MVGTPARCNVEDQNERIHRMRRHELILQAIFKKQRRAQVESKNHHE